MKTFKIIAAVLGALILLAAGYLAYVYVSRGSGQAKDLGVSYTSSDYDSAIAKAQVSVADREKLYLGSTFSTEGKIRVDQIFTDAEISAIQNTSNSHLGYFKDVQIHFQGDDKVEASGFVTHPQVNAPVYVSGKVIKTGPKSFQTSLDRLVVGSAPVLFGIKEIVNSQFNTYVNTILSKIEGLDVESVEIRDGEVRFVGSIPQKIY